MVKSNLHLYLVLGKPVTMIKLTHFAAQKFVKNICLVTVYKENQQNENMCDKLVEILPKCDLKICTEMLIIHKLKTSKTSKTSTINQYTKIQTHISQKRNFSVVVHV